MMKMLKAKLCAPKSVISVFIAATLVLGTGLPMSSAFAAEEEQAKPKPRKTKIIQSMSASVAKSLQKAAELNEAEDYPGVLKTLDGLSKKYDSYNETEKANVQQFYAFTYYQTEQTDKAISAYKKLLAIPNVSEKAEALYRGTLYSLAQMMFLKEDYRGAVGYLEKWFSITPEPGANAYVLLGQGYYQMDDYKKALPAVLKAIDIQNAKGKEVKENWYLLVRAMHFSNESYKEAFDVSKILVQKFPKKGYYSAVAQLYGQLGDEFNQYSSYAAMHDAGMLDSSAEYVTYASLLLQNDRPYKAAVVLEEGLKKKIVDRKENNLKLLANGWMLCKNDLKAIPALEEAAKLGETGDTYASLAQSYLNLEQFDKALKAANNGFKKGKLKRADNAYIVKGMALFSLKRYDESIKAFKSARKDDRSKKMATQWLKYVTGERDREKALKKGLS
jgi:tetratricopeptide (TPR) repeat protein